MTVQAIVENGLLRPTEPLALPEGERVELIVVTGTCQSQGKMPAQAIARIAALPREGRTDGFSARDHDKVLYGAKSAR